MRKHYTLAGNVQGVGFRWFVRDEAVSRGIAGWVRNLADGSVELEAQADAEQLAAFEEALKTGHPWARVSGVKSYELPPTKEETEFTIRH